MADLTGMDAGRLRHAAGAAVVAARTSGQPSQVLPVGAAGGGTPFRIASLTKPFTAVATVLACQRTGTTLETCVAGVLPELRGDWAADTGLTITDVLSQTSGLAPAVTADDIAALGDGDCALMEASRLVVRAGNARPPGSLWEYYNGNYVLAGTVVAALMSTTYEDALSELVLRPWGLTATSFRPPGSLAASTDISRAVQASAYPRGRRPSGGLCSTACDVLTFGEHILEDPGLLDEVRAVRTRSDDPMRYGLGFAIGPSGQMYLNGRLPGYRAALMLIPRNGFIAVALAASSSALPAAARILSGLQHDLTGDDLADAIDAFAA